jgi:PTH1 family peptidyl-tRNA hydrolase
MLIFYGLGNNEDKYLKTKHNAGRLVVENLAKLENLNFQKGDKCFFTKTKWGTQDVIFLYSSGYMNLSGEPLASFLKYFKYDLSQDSDFLVVLQDDSDQIQGNNKFLPGGGTAGHKGIDSIYKQILNFKLDLARLWRLKIGIRPLSNTQKSETFVLSALNPDELGNISDLAYKINQNKILFESKNFEKLQQIINTKPAAKIDKNFAQN